MSDVIIWAVSIFAVIGAYFVGAFIWAKIFHPDHFVGDRYDPPPRETPKLVTVSFGGDFQVEMLASDVAAANELVRTDPHPECLPLMKEVLRANILDILSGGPEGLTEARMAKLKTFMLNWHAMGGR